MIQTIELMSKVSKRILNKTLESYIFELFIKTIVDLKNPADVQNFMGDLLSPPERIMLVKRLAIAILLTKGYTYEKIDNTLKVSRPTIMNVSLCLKHGRNGYQKAVNKILESERRNVLLDKIEDTLLKLSLPKRYGSIAFNKKQKQGKQLFKRILKRKIF